MTSRTDSDTGALQQRNRELTIINKIAEALNRSVDLQGALQAALAKAAELLELQTGWIWLLDEKSGEAYLAAAQNLPPALAGNPGRMEGNCYCLDTYQAGDLDGAANVNVLTCSRLWGLVGGTEGLRYHASIPLYAREKQLGVLNLASPDWRELTGDDLRLLYTIGDLLSIAIERARLYAHSAEFGAAEERSRLAREIHDTLAQGLSGITLQLETADALLEAGGDPQRIQQALRTALSLARSNLEEARRSVLDLRAAPLEGRSLAEALEQLAQTWNHAYNRPRLEVVLQAGNRPLPLRIETGLLRITQEALNNVLQHAQASQVRLQLNAGPERVTLVIQDDGIGFDPRQTQPGRYGLTGLNERARLLGGSLELQTGPRQGTLIRVHIPLEVRS